jgi:hypothetical protein
MMRPVAVFLLALLLAASAAAQTRPIFDLDDFVDPRQRGGAVFMTRLGTGAVKGYVDDLRPLGADAAFLHVTNSLYWGNYQLDFKHSQVKAENISGPVHVQRCDCGPRSEPVYFPTAPTADAVPAAPVPGAKETAQFAFYRSKDSGGAGPPIKLRYRLTWTYQPIDTVVTAAATGAIERISGNEQSYGLEAETHVRIGGHNVFGSVLLARTIRTGTTDDRAQTELAYVSRFPGFAWKRILFKPTLTLGGVSGRGASGLNIVSPALEAFWHEHHTRANLRVIYSPQTLRSGAGGWETHHQVAVLVDRALFIKVFGR